MRFKALATDYDGTIAHNGVVDAATIEALQYLKDSGRQLLLVTGRELTELLVVCEKLSMFDLVIAENGAVMFDPAIGEEIVLAPQPSEALVKRLQEQGVPDVSVGRSIIAFWKPHEVEALDAIRDLGLELNIIFNKDAVMVLPSGISKATGLKVALQRLNLEAANVVGVGDAENDHAFVTSCGFGVAVENAIASLKAEVPYVTRSARGAGVSELIDQIVADDLGALVKQAAALRTA